MPVSEHVEFKMKIEITLSYKENIKLEEWKKSLPPMKKGDRIFNYHFIMTEEKNKEGKFLYNAYIMTNDGSYYSLGKCLL